MAKDGSRLWSWILRCLAALVAVIVLFVAFELVASSEFVHRSQSQLDVSTGRVRNVSWWFGVESVSEPEDTFVSLQLRGEVVGEQSWKPLTTRWGASWVQSHGHSGTDRLWGHCDDLEKWWDHAGFTWAARSESARTILMLLQQEDWWDVTTAYLGAIKLRVEQLSSRPVNERRTEVQDLPDLNDLRSSED